MSRLTHEGRITVKAFASVPALAGLPEIWQQPGSVSNISSLSGLDTTSMINLAEGCMLTKSVKYTHQLTYWMNAIGDPIEVEDVIENELHIIPYEDFRLDDSCNLAYFEAFVHSSLDVYAFIAITASSSTLHDLIEMVKADNNRRQQEMDATGHVVYRRLDFNSPSFTNPEYELVAIHPEHFLPNGNVLSVFHSASSTSTIYVLASDRCLRESTDPKSPRLPPFCHVPESRGKFHYPNIFLVILNAEIKFHRYLHMISQNPPTTPLPDDAIALMHLTVELVDLLYWKPLPKDPQKKKARVSLETRQAKRRRREKFINMDLETRKAYGRALMSGHDTENVDVEAWRQSIDSEP